MIQAGRRQVGSHFYSFFPFSISIASFYCLSCFFASCTFLFILSIFPRCFFSSSCTPCSSYLFIWHVSFHFFPLFLRRLAPTSLTSILWHNNQADHQNQHQQIKCLHLHWFQFCIFSESSPTNLTWKSTVFWEWSMKYNSQADMFTPVVSILDWTIHFLPTLSHLL